MKEDLSLLDNINSHLEADYTFFSLQASLLFQPLNKKNKMAFTLSILNSLNCMTVN